MSTHTDRLRRTALLVGVGMLVSGIALAPSALARPAPPFGFCDGQLATIVITTPGLTTNGTQGPDVIVGSNGVDMIHGRGGADRICGGDGADTITGGDDDDRLHGGAGRDGLYGEGDEDSLHGDGDNDWLNCGFDSFPGPDLDFADGGTGTPPLGTEADVLLFNHRCDWITNVP